MIKLIAVAALGAACLAASAPEPPRLRLPETAAPTRYSVDLTIVPDRDKFHGSVDIEVAIQKPEALLWLNAAGLDIKEATARVGSDTLQATVVPGGDNFAGLQFTREISGTAHLHLSYDGKISRNSSAGLFQLKDGGQEYVYSQFEPTDARRAFPCFDEPKFKTPWQLTLHVRRSDLAFANTPVASEAMEADGMKAVHFAETRPLPSYLVALAVGPFDVVNAGKVGKTPLRIVTPHGRGGEAKFAAESIPQLLKLLEQFFGTPLPYEKLDSVVMPISNFAMENAGMITYGQSLLLSKPERDSIGRQRICAIVTAHEMAHQWFGDLVTTAWWNDIWLNEAFATWMENKIVEQWKPEWNIDITEVDDRLGAMRLDSLVSSRKIRQPIQSDDDIANAFDGITYQKGAAAIQMFERWIGSDTFRKGVRQYVKQHADGNATTADFEAAISAAAGKNIAPAFDTFLDQAGVPLLTVSLDCGAKHPELKMTQKRLLPLGSPGGAAQTWRMPVCVRYEADGEKYSQCEVISEPAAAMELKHGGCPAWLLANDGEAGYYRVDYQGDLLKRLLAENGSHLSAAERVGVLGDVQALVDSGALSPKMALSLVTEFRNDPDHHVIESAYALAQIVRSKIVSADLRARAEEYLQAMFGKRALELGWRQNGDEDENTKLLRQDLVPDVAQDAGQKELIRQAEDLARNWLKERKGISGEMLRPVLRTAAEFGDRAVFDALLEAAKKEQDPRMRETIIGALGSFRDPELAKAAMGLLLTGEFDVREGFYALLFGPLKYTETSGLPFDFVRQNLDALLKHLPREVGDDFAAQLPRTGSAFCDAGHRAEVQEFFGERVKQFTGAPRNLAQALESIDLCIARKKALGPELADFLRNWHAE